MSQDKSSYLIPSVRRVSSNSMITSLGRTIIVFYLKGQHIQQFKQLDINLHEYIQSHSLNIKEIQSIFKQVTTSLMFIHSLGITHTDLKPENIVFANQQKYPDQLNEQENQLNQQIWVVPLKPMNIIVLSSILDNTEHLKLSCDAIPGIPQVTFGVQLALLWNYTLVYSQNKHQYRKSFYQSRQQRFNAFGYYTIYLWANTLVHEITIQIQNKIQFLTQSLSLKIITLNHRRLRSS
ncbi:unnamed protein product [Paramecium sonneborni]|uniref:Protein kinase domain-containing protein n=1 Tax=Paramecium sonneborni TaxID=65129 RepID=A0A8S1QGN4_9CILI|nr:unnamed protein product [Paramecium sonneborni]